jgi:hypothetical protein
MVERADAHRVVTPLGEQLDESVLSARVGCGDEYGSILHLSVRSALLYAE